MKKTLKLPGGSKTKKPLWVLLAVLAGIAIWVVWLGPLLHGVG